MNSTDLAQFFLLTLVLCIGVAAVAGAAQGVNIAENWEENRCDPYVIPFAGYFKPGIDSRTPSQFATDNWSFCQKVYVERAVDLAATVPKGLAAAQEGTVSAIQGFAGTIGDVFFNLWKFCYQTYGSFMDRMKVVAKLFQNFMINLYSIVEKLQASILAIIFGLYSLIISIIDTVQITLIAAIVIIGIIILLQIILFYIFLPISGLIITVSAIVSVAVVIVATAVAAAMVAELFQSGACFAPGTQVLLQNGGQRSIETIRLGEQVRGGGYVTAIHKFHSTDPLYDLHGIHVTGDHLVVSAKGRLIPVRDHPDAIPLPSGFRFWLQGGHELWCLTTTGRRIPCKGVSQVVFADWEEIPEEDEAALTAWYYSVWTELNGSAPSPSQAPTSRILDAEAGLSPDCLISCADSFGRLVNRPLKNVKIGDRIFDTPTTQTRVIGKVRLEGNQATDAVILQSSAGPQIVSCATWFRDLTGIWKPAVGEPIDIHPIEWHHLYTESGSFLLNGTWQIRDASDVGLDHLRPLVESIVLNPAESEHTI